MQKSIGTILLFSLKEIVVKTILLCLLATFITHIFLIVNPVERKEAVIRQLSDYLPTKSYSDQEKRLASYVASDVHKIWLNSTKEIAPHQARSIFSFWMTRDMAAAMSFDPSLRKEDSRVNQEKFLFYFFWLKNLLQGKLGYIEQGLSLKSELFARLPTTCLLAFTSLFITVFVAFYGALSYFIKKRWKIIKAQDFLFYSISSLPAFVVGYFFLRVFAVGGVESKVLILPILTLVVSNGILAEILVVMKNSLSFQYQKNYVVFAISKGTSKSKILIRHVLRNTLIEILPKISQKMAFVVGGTIVVEKVFSLNGLGDMLIDGLGNHDNGRVLIVILVATVLVRIGSIVSDAMLFFLNPRFGQHVGHI